MLQIELAAPAVLRWFAGDRPVRVLHHNAEMWTLVDDGGAVCSLVSATRGLGPFAGVVLGGEWGRGKEEAGEGGCAEVRDGVVWFAGVGFAAAGAGPWAPRVRWQGLPPLDRSTDAPKTLEPTLVSSAVELVAAVQSRDWETALGSVHHLAGRGPGLTPVGDDLILGVILALHALAHPWTAKADELADKVAPRTTTLSGAWVRAAARGEAAIAWHQLAHARSPRAAAAAIRSIQRWGSSSGEAAWWSFSRLLTPNP